MVGTLQPLDQMFSIVGEDGKPTDYFTRWAQQRQIDISSAISLADVQAYLATINLTAGAGLTGGGTIAASRTFNVGAGTGLVANPDDIAIDTVAEAERARVAISVPPTTVSTTTYTLVLADAYEYVRLTNAAGCVVTVPPNASVAFNIGDTITFRAVTSAACSFAPGAGVTLNKTGGGVGAQTFAEIGATTQLKKVATNEWDMIGGLI